MLEKLLFVILFFLISIGCCFAQDITSRLLPLSPSERVCYVSGYVEANNLVYTDKFDSFLQQLKSFAEQQNDVLLLNHVEYFRKSESIFHEQNVDAQLALIKKIQLGYKKDNNLYYTGDCFASIGQIRFRRGEYALAFENILAADEIFRKMGYANVPTMGKYLHDFALYYYFFQDYKKAIMYMNESIKLPKYNDNIDIQRYNTLGSSYLKLNDTDKAHYYFTIAYKKAKIYKDKTWIGLLAGNIGEVLYQKGEYRKALDHFLENAEINGNTGFSEEQYSASLNLVKTYLKLGDIAKASQSLSMARNFFPKPKTEVFGNQQLLEKAKLNYYDVSHQYYLATGNFRIALKYADSLYTSEKLRDGKYNTLLVEKASDQLQLLRSRMIFQKKELIHEKEKGIKNVVIVSLCIIFLLAAILVLFISKNRKKLHEQRQLLLSSQLERAEHNLRLSETKLHDFTLRIQEKSKLIEDMDRELREYSDAGNTLVNQLQQSTILTEDDWLNFKSLFEQVHSGFLYRLKEKYPEFSPAEIRYISLAKLNFTTKEMATALGVSTQSIRTNWYRIRKKLNLSDTMNVEDLIAGI